MLYHKARKNTMRHDHNFWQILHNDSSSNSIINEKDLHESIINKLNASSIFIINKLLKETKNKSLFILSLFKIYLVTFILIN